jgi:hypothetical protein
MISHLGNSNETKAGNVPSIHAGSGGNSGNKFFGCYVQLFSQYTFGLPKTAAIDN